ncbi:NEL-type E3 ubiquitin ligase domain-containing protein [Pseudomonas citrulli]|uniref:RING-type E3 ubiquitin transferase n=1 Tax=Pseudomonas citrulli TaxID=3064347 RepID=A0ABT9C4W0_9PSED|nr:DUF6543 domain-containing protein [Pseudomonas sp. K18]MDO7898109.1 NEL-type E3 ubiquitin ligase domain-containing protein [Pseudomonas sp. K18]
MPGPTPPLADARGGHLDLLRSRIPAWYHQATAQRQQELDAHSLELPDWYAKASLETRASLKDSHSRYRDRLSAIDNRLSEIQDIRAFAEPLLDQAIQQAFKRSLNVNEVYFVRKYVRKTRDDLFGALVLDDEGARFDRYEYRGTSLLEAALANFEPDETLKPACDDCSLITRVRPVAQGDVMPSAEAFRAGALPIAPEAFARLCRQLDLGRQYQEHVAAIVQPKDATRRRLERQLREYHRKAMALDIQVALAKGDISPSAWRMLQQVMDGAGAITLDGQAVTFTTLNVFGIELVGPVLIGPDRERSRRVVRLVAYLPGDPEHPLKEYASSGEFMAELRQRLHRIAYRRFFSRFLPLRQQGIFFRQFQQLYQPAAQPGEQVDYPLKPPLRHLPIDTSAMTGDLWDSLRLRQTQKILADARAVAVPTGDEDRKARLARLDSYLNAVVDVFNLAAFVVPGLGPLMLTVGAVQMLDEAFEGIEAFEQGEIREMWAHFSSVALNTAFIATGAAVLPHIQWSSTVDGLQAVQLANGESRLWRPDLDPYRSEIEPPVDASPDAQGLYRVDDRQLLSLDERYYQVEYEPQTLRYRIRHPSNPQAYQPELTHNGSGAWHHELERPLGWEGTTLMRRLGPMVQDFSDIELEQIRLASATPEAVLRRVHVEGEPVPVLLADTLERFGLCRKIERFISQLQGDEPLRHGQADPMGQLYLLTRYGPWPRGLKLRVVDGAGRDRWTYVRPSEGTLVVREIVMAEGDLQAASVLERLIEAADAVGVDVLAATRPPIAKTNMAARVRQLRGELAKALANDKVQVLNDFYARRKVPTDPYVALLKSRFPSVPTAAIEQVLGLASPDERQHMEAWDFADAHQTKPIPLRIAEELRHYQRGVRLNRAYEGMYQPMLATADTPRLVLATLQTLPGWSDTVRIELREGTVSGALIDSIGPRDARQVKLVVRDDDHYKAFDDKGNELSHWRDIYEALQHALPDAERQAMGRPSIHHAGLLKDAMGATPLDRDALAKRLEMPALKPTFKSPMRLASGKVGYPMGGLRERLGLGPSPESRVRDLYPGYSTEQVRALLESLGDGAVMELKRRKVELKMLRRDLDRWVATPARRDVEPPFSEDVPRTARQVVAEQIVECWRRQSRFLLAEGGESVGYELDLTWLNVGTLPDLTADFSHVGVLGLSGMGLSLSRLEHFLALFPSVRWLDLTGNRLTEVPEALRGMTGLTRLNLGTNSITLTPGGAGILQDLTRLEILFLERNPLALLPDFSALRELRHLGLRRTGIDTWPRGLGDQPLQQLDLRDNRLTEVPDELLDPLAGQAYARALINRGTLLQGNPLSERTQARLSDYWASLSLLHPDWALQRLPDAFGYAASVGRANVQFWTRGLSGPVLTDRIAVWLSLSGDAGSEEFFELLSRLAESYQGRKDYPDLQARVWRMLEAAARSTDLRRELFDWAGRPACEDRAALSFSYLEIRLMIHDAKALASGRDEAAALVDLAKGLFRLDEVERIALQDIQRRRDAINARLDLSSQEKLENLALIEEVEVRLAYRMGLKERLALPGQPSGADFALLGEVARSELDAAAARILALDDSPQQFQALVGRDFWVDYLKQQHGPSFQALTDSLIAEQIKLDEARAGGLLKEADYVGQSEALDLHHKIQEAELIQSLTRTELDALANSTDL